MTLSKRNTSFQSRVDRATAAVLGLCALISAAVVALILVFLLEGSWPILTKVSPARFFGDDAWHPAQGLFDITPMLSATLLSSLGALLLALPLGVASALFGLYYAPPWLATIYRRLIELLAGIPSVVFGFWGLTTLAPLLGRWQPPGVSLLAAAMVLALMILPTVALTAEAALAALPFDYRRHAAALGLSRWVTISGVLLPAARSGIASGTMLAAGRAIGETMAVLMVAGNVVQLPQSLFDPVRTLTANIALELAYASGDHRSALFVSGLALLLMTLALVVGAEALKGRSRDG